MALKKSKARGLQKNSILYIANEILRETCRPMTYKELYDAALNKDYQGQSSLKVGPGVFRHRIKEDISRQKGESLFQLVGYRQMGLKEWGFPNFDEEEYKRNLKEQELANKKVSVMAATIEALEERGKPRRVKDIHNYVINRKNVIFKTKTPFKTVNGNITHEINDKGDKSRFFRVSKGLIGLSKWNKD